MSAPWDDVAAAWDEDYDWYARSVVTVTERVCRAVAFPGARVLDVASGTGQPALAIAERVGPTGRVVATDLSPAMVGALDRRRRAAGLASFEVHVMDAQRLRFDDRCFDAVTCACGLPFCPDPIAALREMRRVVTPGGPVAVVVWDDPASTPFFRIAREALALAVVGEAGRLPGSLHGETALADVLRAGGFARCVVERCEVVFELDSVEAYWNQLTRFAPGVAATVAALDERNLARVADAVRAAAAPFVRDGRPRLPATALVATARA